MVRDVLLFIAMSCGGFASAATPASWTMWVEGDPPDWTALESWVTGGGDAKFVAAIALWLGFYELPAYLIVASILGGALTLSLLWFRTLPLPLFMVKREWIARLHDRESGIPYGVALGVAGLLMFQHSIWFDAAAQAA